MSSKEGKEEIRRVHDQGWEIMIEGTRNGEDYDETLKRMLSSVTEVIDALERYPTDEDCELHLHRILSKTSNRYDCVITLGEIDSDDTMERKINAGCDLSRDKEYQDEEKKAEKDTKEREEKEKVV
jgi:hypothetical protein